MDATNAVQRPPKRDMNSIEDEGSTGQPVAKNVKMGGEPVPSLEVVELQKQLLAEKKRADDLETKIEISARLEDARRNAETTVHIELARENKALEGEMADMRKEYQERTDEMTQQMNKGHHEKLAEISRENEVLKTEMVKMREEHHEKLQQLQKEQDRALKKEREDHGRIVDLTQKLAKHERAATAAARMARGVNLHENGHPNDIFQLCLPESNESMPYDIARQKIIAVYDKNIDSLREEYQLASKKSSLWDDLMDRSLVKDLFCDACDKCFYKWKIVDHFLTGNHAKKMRVLGAAVSTAAVEYWVGKLTQDPSTKPTLQQLRQMDYVAEREESARKNAEFEEYYKKHYPDAQPVQQPDAVAGPVQQHLSVLAASAASPNATEAPEEIEKKETDD